jgi:RNA polymerase sigma-70 factor (sigma-E family)
VNPESEREYLDFVEARTAALFRAAYALAGQQQAAEDLLQTALERLATRWRRVRDPEAYARRVIYHEYLSWWRRWRRRETPVADVSDRPCPDDPAGTVVLRSTLRAALDRLGARQRAVLVLRYLEDRSEQEVADILGCSVKTVSSQATRALARLRTTAPFLAGSDGVTADRPVERGDVGRPERPPGAAVVPPEATVVDLLSGRIDPPVRLAWAGTIQPVSWRSERSFLATSQQRLLAVDLDLGMASELPATTTAKPDHAVFVAADGLRGFAEEVAQTAF